MVGTERICFFYVQGNVAFQKLQLVEDELICYLHLRLLIKDMINCIMNLSMLRRRFNIVFGSLRPSTSK